MRSRHSSWLSLVGLLLLASGLFQAQPNELLVGGDYARMLDAHLTAAANRLLDERAEAIARLRTRDDIEARQATIRTRLTALIGGLPAAKTPLNARTTSRFVREGYRVENVIYESLPGFRVTANLYLPTRGMAPYPAIIGTAGHSTNGKASAVYQSAWIGFATRGYVVLAFDPPGQGERLEYYDPDTGRSRAGIGVPEHIMAGTQAMLTGATLARYMAIDGIRAFDYLLTRPEVDPARIAVAGNSGGGTQAAYLAVLDPRLAAAVVSCYITGWRELWPSEGPQDAEQVFPGFLREGFDFGDFLLAFAPKPILMTTAVRDFFPIDGARKTYREAATLFDRLGAADRAGYFEYDDTHGWSKPRREAAYRWLDKHFLKRDSAGDEGPVEPEPDSVLYATPTGQLSTSSGSETVQSLNLAVARRLEQSRPAATREQIARALELPVPQRAPAFTDKGRIRRSGYEIEKLEIESRAGVRVPALKFVPDGVSGPAPAILVVSSLGKTRESQAGQDVLEFVRAGRIVLAVDPRGIGEAAPPPRTTGYDATYQLAARTWLTGQPLAAMQVEDVLLAFRLLQADPRVDAARISIVGKESAGALALLAAALEPAIQQVAIERSITSFMDIVRAKIHQNVTHLVVPGALKTFDLPDAFRAIAPRRVWVVSPVQPNGAPAVLRDVRQRMARIDRGGHVTVLERMPGSPAAKFYAKWLAE
ncbi:MAG TPA: acetylxylan esterase [Vicinamibacterales bacterium]|nr:acetylxylan esterase [Vicinamibacterales bacterium]